VCDGGFPSCLCNRSFRIRRILRRYCGDERNRRLIEMMRPRPLPQLPPRGCKGVGVAVGGGDEKRLKRGVGSNLTSGKLARQSRPLHLHVNGGWDNRQLLVWVYLLRTCRNRMGRLLGASEHVLTSVVGDGKGFE